MALTVDQVVKLYVAMFQRAPEQQGLNFWYNAAYSGNWDEAKLATEMFKVAVQAVNQNVLTYGSIYPAYVGIDPSSLTLAQATAIVDQMYKVLFNKDKTVDPNGVNFWATAIANNPSNIGKVISDMIAAAESLVNSTDPATKAAAQAFVNKVQAAKQIVQYVPDLNTLSVSDLKALIQNVTDDPATITNAVNQVTQTAVTGQTYNLTPGADNISGTDANDMFVATAGNLNDYDILDGKGGYDKLFATINADVTPTQIKNIEEINLTFGANDKTFGMDNVTGVNKLTIDAASLGNNKSLTISNIGTTNIETTLKNLYNNRTATFIFTDAALSGSNDTFKLHLNGNSGAITIRNANSTSTNGLETLNLYSEGSSANTISTLTVNPLKNLNISGTQNLTITNQVIIADNGTVDASGLNANATLKLTTNGVTSTMTVKGGAKNDTITIKDVKNLTADLGAGDDIITNAGSTTNYDNVTANLGDGNNGTAGSENEFVLSATGTANITSGSGNDYINVENGKNITINAGDGDNTIKVGTVTAPADDATINITGGAGVDNVTVDLGNTSGTKTATVNIDTGAGNDTITVKNGNGVPNADSVTIKAGAGNDNIYLGASASVSGSNGNYQGAAKIYGGAGQDTIVLNSTHAASTIVLTKDDLSTIVAGQTTVAGAKADTIYNFDTSKDKIDLTDLFSFYSESNSPAEVATSLPSNLSSVKNGGVYFNNTIPSGTSTNHYINGIEFVVVNVSQDLDSSGTNDSAIYYVKDANNDGIIQANEVKLVAVVVDVTLLPANIT